MENLVVGIDLAFRKGRRLPIMFASDRQGRVVPIARDCLPTKAPVGRGNRVVAEAKTSDPEDPVTAFACQVRNLIREVEGNQRAKVKRIAIDAPRGAATQLAMRESEQAMHDDGIRFIRTPDDLEAVREKAYRAVSDGVPDSRLPEANRLWILVGVRLFEILGEEFGGDRLIEVYPYAAFHRLGVAASKSSPEGKQQRIEVLAKLGGWNDIRSLKGAIRGATWGSMDDAIDAYLCAVLAGRADQAEAYCGPDPNLEDCIWMPPRPA